MFEFLKRNRVNKKLDETLDRFPQSINPESNPIAYHYCSLETFLSMLQSKSFWLSDINSMNDYSESHWAYDRFIEAANIELDSVGQDFLDAFDKYLSSAQTRHLPLICCFSSDGDVLSQWRAYADDGRGVAIGFDTALLNKLSVRTTEIAYDQKLQVNHFRAVIRAVFDVYSSLPDDEKEDFLAYSGTTAGIDLICFKNPAFSEERELRLVRAILSLDAEGAISFRDVGGGGEDKSAESLDIKFRSRDGGLVTYVSLPFEGLGSEVIKEVVLGPKTKNNGVEVIAALKSFGFHEATIRHSTATYR